jgi:NADPH-dependent 2,4-dienoyl-CoA reductase/sulfur reductase-like enzyme
MLRAMDHIVVVGGSLGGLRACEQLRTSGYAGRITLVGAEAHEPYDRPPLSKKLLAGDWDPDRIRLRKPGELDELGVAARLGAPAVHLDPERQVVELDGAADVGYDGLIVATGAAPRHLPGQPQAAGIHVLRTLDDSLGLRAELVDGARVVIIGAGFIGLEVAATARGRGCEVTVLEGLPAPLVRALGAEMGAAVAAVHGRNGVDVRCAVQVAGIEVEGGHVRAVALADGGEVPADVVVVGIGVTPQVDWLAGSGAELRDGVVCDEALWTRVPNVFAAGDCVRWFNRLYDEEMRVEHWTNAAEQGAAAAKNLLATAAGEPTVPYAPVPFFWSDQYDSRIQYLGRAAGADDEQVEVVAGDLGGRFAALYGHAGRFRAVLGVTMPRMVMPMRKLLTERASWDEALAFAEQARPT